VSVVTLANNHGLDYGVEGLLEQAGADIIVGGHAHVPQGAGRLSASFIAYGLGNLLFGSAGDETSDSGVLVVRATGHRLDGWRWEPVRLVGGRPEPVDDPAAARRRLNDLRGCTNLAADPEQ
jgi:poly-gamma-glutamate capsule biosynthesis protein CapA/YwtB (metallophosphatase superfamily)